MREYLRAMGLHAVYITKEGRAHSTGVPAGQIADVVWTSQFGARAIALHLNKREFATLQEAATALRINIIEHVEMLRRIGVAVKKVNTALAHAKADGEVRHFENTVAEYRRSAAKQGVRAMTYARAYTRLRAALFVYAATDNALPPITELSDVVLSDAARRKQKKPRPRRTRQSATVTLKFG